MNHQPKIETSPKVSDEVRKTTCYMCACRCGINVHMRDGEVSYIEGNRDHPVNKGFSVPRAVLASCSTSLPPACAPLLRTGPRGFW